MIALLQYEPFFFDIGLSITDPLTLRLIDACLKTWGEDGWKEIAEQINARHWQDISKRCELGRLLNNRADEKDLAMPEKLAAAVGLCVLCALDTDCDVRKNLDGYLRELALDLPAVRPLVDAVRNGEPLRALDVEKILSGEALSNPPAMTGRLTYGQMEVGDILAAALARDGSIPAVANAYADKLNINTPQALARWLNRMAKGVREGLPWSHPSKLLREALRTLPPPQERRRRKPKLVNQDPEIAHRIAVERGVSGKVSSRPKPSC